jgi:hypothetical protein
LCVGIRVEVVLWIGVGVGIGVAFETHVLSLISYLTRGVGGFVFWVGVGVGVGVVSLLSLLRGADSLLGWCSFSLFSRSLSVLSLSITPDDWRLGGARWGTLTEVRAVVVTVGVTLTEERQVVVTVGVTLLPVVLWAVAVVVTVVEVVWVGSRNSRPSMRVRIDWDTERCRVHDKRAQARAQYELNSRPRRLAA